MEVGGVDLHAAPRAVHLGPQHRAPLAITVLVGKLPVGGPDDRPTREHRVAEGDAAVADAGGVGVVEPAEGVGEFR